MKKNRHMRMRDVKAPPVIDIEAEWPKVQPRNTDEKKESAINRFSFVLNGSLVKLLSNLRLSLTLRIALHYAGQLLRSTIGMLLVAMAALVISQVPAVIDAIDVLSLIQPEDGINYSQAQLEGLPVTTAYVAENEYTGDFDSFMERLSFSMSGLRADDRTYQIRIYANTAQGGLIAIFPLKSFLYMATILFWTLLCFDLYRVGYFLSHRNKLNNKVLKPITDMAETAATLSASNLSDRISVDGTKNELKDLALVFNGMLDRIELSYNSQKQFVSDASHELRTPIAVIQGYAGMLERWGKTDKEILDEGITAISQEASSMKELVERLLFLARHDKKTMLLEMEDFNPLEVMSEVTREAKLLSAVHRFELSPAQNAKINGDKSMIKQLMRILVDNAIKYTPADGAITLGVKCDSKSCILSVNDTGAGISIGELPKVFDRFYRCDEARQSQTSGHGLGLSIARIIVVAHGGKLKVRSKVGAGTTFSVSLPLVP
ncbi:MAG: HAMP domain-containing histidine kinase [Clostridiales bacterium]|nr:HAMP domain-containing histidine kinase [Clostridiales bacterium]